MALKELAQMQLLLTVLSVFIGHRSISDAWLLAQAGLSESYRVRHLSMHFSRVFLSITVESDTFPTLIESQWPETYLPMRTEVFPQPEAHANGDHSDCALIHQARWTQVDSLSRLWVMDQGWSDAQRTCSPKLLVYDLIRNNAEVLRIDCGHYITPSDAALLVMKLGPRPSCCHKVEKYIYFILANDSHILAYDIVEQHWHQSRLISRKYQSVQDTFPVTAVDFAFDKERQLLISDADGSLYTATKEFPQTSSSCAVDNAIASEEESIELELLGQLLGPSKEMMVDQYGALFYVVPKFGAVVRCTCHQNLTAEGNEIIYMTPKNIQQIFFGSEGSVWLLTDRLLRPQDQCLPGL